MSRPLAAYADEAAALVYDVSADCVAALSSLYGINLTERRANLLALATAVTAGGFCDAEDVRRVVDYYALCDDAMPAFGRLLLAVAAKCDRDRDKALSRLLTVTR